MVTKSDFWSNVDQSAGHDSCWVWTGGKIDGYGSFSHDGITFLAHRVAWELAYGSLGGPIPDGFCVLHHCDNRPCVRPTHLFLGTRNDNNKDRHAKGRSGSAKGVANANAKLNDDLVHEIRQLAKTMPQKEIALKFGFSRATISGVIVGTRWKHVPVRA